MVFEWRMDKKLTSLVGDVRKFPPPWVFREKLNIGEFGGVVEHPQVFSLLRRIHINTELVDESLGFDDIADDLEGFKK